MRVLYLADPFLPIPPAEYGGIERIAASVIRDALHHNHQAALVAHPDSHIDGVPFWPLAGGARPCWKDHFANLDTIRAAFRAFQPDLIHSFARLAYLAPLLHHCTPKIMAFHRHPTPRTVRLAARLGGLSLTFTGCSEFITRRGAAMAGRWQAVPNGIDLDRFTFQPAVAPDAPLVFLSRLEEIKGAHLAIAAARAAGLPLILAGNRPNSAYFDREIAPWLGRDGISYVGPVDDAQKNELLGRARALLVPIEWDEPFGLVFVEALACGTPMISMTRGALFELIEHGRHGYLCSEPVDLPGLIAQVGQIDRTACRRRAEMFSSAVMSARHETLYAQLVPAAARRPGGKNPGPSPERLITSNLAL